MTDKKQAWTAEPWWTDPRDKHWINTRPRFVTVCEEIQDEPNAVDRANAARIVACVNALAGIDDPVEWRRLVEKALAGRYEWKTANNARDRMYGAIDTFEALDALLALQPPTEEETSDV